MTTVRNLRSNSQDDDDAAPLPVKQVEGVTPAPPHGSPPVREASTASAGERLRLAISGWRGPPPSDRVSFDEELRNFDDDFKEEAVADLLKLIWLIRPSRRGRPSTSSTCLRWG